MAAEQLDAFLKGEAPPPETEATRAAPVESTPQAGGNGTKPPDTPIEADDIPEPEGNEPLPHSADGRTVPLSALEGERKARQDWKAKAIEAETKRAELQRQLEAATKPREPEPERQPPRVFNPAEDPQGFMAEVERRQINHHLNVSEMLMRKDIGNEATDALVAEFREMAKADPSLSAKLYAQPHPFEFAKKYVETAKMQREIGDDPGAYKARLRAEWEAEQANGQPPPKVSPASGIAPSLANARSAAPRSAPAFSGPPSLDDILATRKK